jgi:hypothetical protein
MNAHDALDVADCNDMMAIDHADGAIPAPETVMQNFTGQSIEPACRLDILRWNPNNQIQESSRGVWPTNVSLLSQFRAVT